jgi:hypothetical protein
MHFWLPGRNLIVLNSDKVANDLLQSRSTKYSSRPYVPVFDLYVPMAEVHALLSDVIEGWDGEMSHHSNLTGESW